MARFVFSLNLPAISGKASQEVIAEHSAGNVADLFSVLAHGAVWIEVNQLYQFHRQWKPRGPLLLNTAYIGKVKPFVENNDEED